MVRGIGGVFIYAENAQALVDWYATHLGITFALESAEGSYYRDFVLPVDPAYGREEREVFAIRQADLKRPKTSSVVINWRVHDLQRVLDHLRSLGVVIDKVEEYDYGRFAWLRDGEGNQLELFATT
jgi:predicted enzyme related to lactoylglutathione lyase